ncbi:DUF192 domain-containing protein, partial [Ectothiorhodospiraceae bacterium WFHF3C12]|nr:DUF192 domain-containing protein [Ectothiorhodospiraceae bacterium WFHF3C12]
MATVVLVGLGFLTACADPEPGVYEIPHGTILVDGHPVPARIADEPRERAQGFQHTPAEVMRRERIYFAFPRPTRPSYHMENVVAPLVIAWIGPDHRITALSQMEPGKSGYRPPGPIIAALEVTPDQVEPLGLAVGVAVRRAAPA